MEGTKLPEARTPRAGVNGEEPSALKESTRIEVGAGFVRVRELEIRDEALSQRLEPLAEPDRALEMRRIVEVGFYCLERAGSARDLDFVRHQVGSLLHQVDTLVRGIPASLESQLASRLGTGEGQVLSPVVQAVNHATEATHQRIREVESLLKTDMDPASENSQLGRALRSIRDLLDPQRTDSIQGSLGEALRSVTGPEGHLALTVKNVVQESVRPLAEEVNRLSQLVSAKDQLEALARSTTLKGAEFEEHLITRLQNWARIVGAQVEHVGTDNQPGDAVVVLAANSFAPVPLRLAVEAKDIVSERRGRKVIQDQLSLVMRERHAQGAVYLNRSEQGLALEIGDWAEGEAAEGPWVACTDEHLFTALRFLAVMLRLKARESTDRSFDPARVSTEAQRLRDALQHLRKIRNNVTQSRSLLEDIDREAQRMRQVVEDSLEHLEGVVGRVGQRELPEA